MNEKNRKRISAEWNKILKDHSAFARTFLVQQAVLMEVSELGFKLVDRSMYELIESGLPVLFEKFWINKFKDRILGKVEIGGIIGCLSNTNRDPARCFGSDDPEGWFEDPLAGGQTLPPKPPDPHIR